jgi:hypothetical protein
MECYFIASFLNIEIKLKYILSIGEYLEQVGENVCNENDNHLFLNFTFKENHYISYHIFSVYFLFHQAQHAMKETAFLEIFKMLVLNTSYISFQFAGSFTEI